MSKVIELENNINKQCNIINLQSTINTFEKEWCKWDVDDTIEWFKFIVEKENNNVNYDDNDINEYESNSDDQQDEVDLKHQHLEQPIEPNWDKIGQNLLVFQFRTKTIFPSMNHGLLKHFGVRNKQLRNKLLENITQLTQKYPKRKRRNNHRLNN